VFRIEGLGRSCDGSIVENGVKKLQGVESFALAPAVHSRIGAAV
jgi:hypothetical protein